MPFHDLAEKEQCFLSFSPVCSSSAEYSVGPNGHKYLRCDSKKGHADAKAACNGEGGYLVTISDQEEQDFVSSLPV